ncbi:MAG: HAMP domain-containing histidine kinase, partial [Anaerolineales bacterium]|nr:HAMP domain-containing histidine kinase [Anaerolineales bacterium]
IENARLFQQSDVIAEVMHELKTPLLALQAAIELLERPQLPEGQRHLILSTMKSEGNRLTKMIQGFLELSRLDSGRVRIAWEPLDIWQIVHDVVHIQRLQAAQKNITIEVSSSVDPLPQINGDADRLIQVVINLVSNAIKYNNEGGTITVHIHPEGTELYLSVSDTGPGISAENLRRLFDRFYRVPGSEGYSEGTGLGLSIAQKIVEAHGGRIEVESELGKGTTFHCVLKMNQ